MGVLRSAYFRLVEREFVWRHVVNARATREYGRYRPKLSTEAARMLASLDETGLAISHVDRLDGAAELFVALREASVTAEAAVKARMGHAAQPQGEDDDHSMSSNLLGAYPRMDPQSIFARFTTQPELLEVINGYFGMFTQLRLYAVFRARQVQLGVNAGWHRDGVFATPILRVFVYFSEVTTDNGALRYAVGTHHKSAIGSRRVMSDAELNRRAVVCTGSPGTIVLADTRGYHKATKFVRGERWLYNSIFTSPGLGRDELTRLQPMQPRPLEPVSWAFSSPLTLRQNFIY